MTEKSFMEFLREKETVPEKDRLYYQRWVRSYLNFRAARTIGDNSVEGFMKCLVGKYGNLQVKQARHAMQLYSAFRMRCGTPLTDRVVDKQAETERPRPIPPRVSELQPTPQRLPGSPPTTPPSSQTRWVQSKPAAHATRPAGASSAAPPRPARASSAATPTAAAFCPDYADSAPALNPECVARNLELVLRRGPRRAATAAHALVLSN